MTTSTRYKKFNCGGVLTAAAVSAMLVVGSSTGANAWHYGKAHGSGILPGVIGGAIVGGAIKGKKGILPGAIIGGAISGIATQTARPAPPPAPRPYYPAAPAYNNGLVYSIQSSLIKLGYNPGPVDGVYGQRTADAISAYEYNSQLPVTGQATPGIDYHMSQAVKQAGG